jgi:hypothetical protein
MEWRSFHTLPCVITRTPSKVPEIARVHARVTALVGCNGSLAKSGAFARGADLCMTYQRPITHYGLGGDFGGSDISENL